MNEGFGTGYVGASITTTSDILQRIPQDYIYEFIVGYKPVVGEYVVSPLRNDAEAGAWYEWGYNGKLLFIDYADPDRNIRDCFQMLMDMEGINLPQAIQQISEEFDAPIMDIVYPEFAVKKKSSYSKEMKGNHIQRDKSNLTETHDGEITFKARVFGDRDRAFWYNRYGITRKQLIDDKVFPIIWYRFYSKKKKEWLVIRPMDVAYAYTDFEQEGRIKIYCPFNKNKAGKFITNCDSDDIGCLNSLISEGSQLIVTKSYKDCRVLRNLGINAIWFQNEGQIPDSDQLLNLCLRFKEIIVLFDNDETGIKASEKVSLKLSEFNLNTVRTVHIPYYNPNIKDPSDLIHREDKQSLINFLNLNGIYGDYSTGGTSIMDTPFDTSV